MPYYTGLWEIDTEQVPTWIHTCPEVSESKVRKNLDIILDEELIPMCVIKELSKQIPVIMSAQEISKLIPPSSLLRKWFTVPLSSFLQNSPVTASKLVEMGLLKPVQEKEPTPKEKEDLNRKYLATLLSMCDRQTQEKFKRIFTPKKMIASFDEVINSFVGNASLESAIAFLEKGLKIKGEL